MARVSYHRISNDPMTRVPGEMRKMLEEKEIFFDIHCHVFNYQDVPDKFIGIRLPYNRIFLAGVERLLHRIINRTDKDPFSNLAWFIHFFRKTSSDELAKRLNEHYSGMNVILCPLMMDMAPGIAGKIIDDYHVQIEKIKTLRDLNPEKILPFFAADPNNPEVINHFRRVFSRDEGYLFYGIKVYPSLGYLPSHPVQMEIFRICEKKKIPVTAHCGGAAVHSSKRVIENILGYHLLPDGTFSDEPITRSFKGKKDYALFFNHPFNWKPVMNRFPGLKLNLAHFGGDQQWEMFIQGKQGNWVSCIIEMMEKYPGIFTDLSYVLHKRKFYKHMKKILLEKEKLSDRIMYGSDYYMIVRERPFDEIFRDFRSEMGDEMMNKMAGINPRKFLFG